MYKIKSAGLFDIPKMLKVTDILYKCGKDMARRYDLHHWDNPKLKSFLIAEYCSLRNRVYIVYEGNIPVATFQVRMSETTLHFEKLATSPDHAGKGIGSLCLKAIDKIALKNKCNKITMEVYAPSRHALDFYLHRGYIVVGETNTLKYKELKMEKYLSV